MRRSIALILYVDLMYNAFKINSPGFMFPLNSTGRRENLSARFVSVARLNSWLRNLVAIAIASSSIW